MKTYAINLVVDAKNTDVYDKVSLNKFPIIIKCKTEAELKEVLINDDTINYVKSFIKSQRVFNTAEWMIRSIYSNDEVRELVWKVSDLCKIEF